MCGGINTGVAKLANACVSIDSEGAHRSACVVSQLTGTQAASTLTASASNSTRSARAAPVICQRALTPCPGAVDGFRWRMPPSVATQPQHVHRAPWPCNRSMCTAPQRAHTHGARALADVERSVTVLPVGSKGALAMRRTQGDRLDGVMSDYSKNTITFALVRPRPAQQPTRDTSRAFSKSVRSKRRIAPHKHFARNPSCVAKGAACSASPAPVALHAWRRIRLARRACGVGHAAADPTAFTTPSLHFLAPALGLPSVNNASINTATVHRCGAGVVGVGGDPQDGVRLRPPPLQLVQVRHLLQAHHLHHPVARDAREVGRDRGEVRRVRARGARPLRAAAGPCRVPAREYAVLRHERGVHERARVAHAGARGLPPCLSLGKRRDVGLPIRAGLVSCRVARTFRACGESLPACAGGRGPWGLWGAPDGRVSGGVCDAARRVQAMESSTKNSTEMLEKLTLMFNRTRQAKITTELNEIISGALSLEEAS